MTKRERILSTLKGKSVDRPAVSFYELNGYDEDTKSADVFNIYSHPSWGPLINLAREKTDRIIIRGVVFDSYLPDPLDSISEINTQINNGQYYFTKIIKTAERELRIKTRRNPDINTIWTEEHLLKDINDLRAFLSLPLDNFGGNVDLGKIKDTEIEIGDTGIIMFDTPDPLCLAASLFDLGIFSIFALTEQVLFHSLMEKFAEILYKRIAHVTEIFPGYLWRIYGPEYASAPILPPKLFKEYVVKYDTQIINMIKKSGGYARIHSHGNLKAILDDILNMGTDALDPIEPPPQGDVELSYVRKNYGKDMVLFGNLEISDIENQPTEKFAEKIKKAIGEGTAGDGRGFVLMPSAAPYGRILSTLAIKNYEKIIEIIENY